MTTTTYYFTLTTSARSKFKDNSNVVKALEASPHFHKLQSNLFALTSVALANEDWMGILGEQFVSCVYGTATVFALRDNKEVFFEHGPHMSESEKIATGNGPEFYNGGA